MIFEVPVDHFPVQRARLQRPQPLILPQISIVQSRAELSANVVSSPSVQRSQFTFFAVTRQPAADIPIRRISPPRTAPRPAVPILQSLGVPKIFSEARRFLSAAVLSPQLA
ncbi:hypothetical protein V3C99_015373 [Haemonchus contortus]|uniref:Uncharacterized protein n=1 Tax=Haemonchus contortus TaxID=6289 RepID=A0A7I4YWF9_HAECO